MAGGGARSGGTQQVTETRQLPKWQEPHLKRVAQDAGKIYGSGYGGFDPYPGATYIPPTGDERTAASATRRTIGFNPLLGPSLRGWGSIQQGGGLLGGHRRALGTATDAAAGFGNVYRKTGTPSMSERTLGGMGHGAQSLDHRFGGLLGSPSFAHRNLRGVASGDPIGGGGLMLDAARDLEGPSFAQQNVRPIAGGAALEGQQGLRGWLARSGPLASERHLQGIARGDFLDGSNPYLDDIISNATDRAEDATAGLFSSAGRYGGGAHQGVAAREAAQIATDFLGREYDQERQRQPAAAGQIDQAMLGRRGQELSGLGQQVQADAQRRSQQMQAAGMLDDTALARSTARANIGGMVGDRDLARRGQQIQAAGLLDDAFLDRLGARAGLLGEDLDRRMGAAGQMDEARMARLGQALAALGGQGQTALGAGNQFGGARDALQRNTAMGPAMRGMMFDDANRLMGLGAAERAELQQELQSNIGRWRDEQLAPFRELEMYSGLLTGLPDMSTRMRTSTETIPRGSPIAGLLGGGMTGATMGGQLLGPMAAAGMSTGPLAPFVLGGGALLGGLGGLLG